VKLPAVAVTAVFICGILLGLYPPIARYSSSSVLLVCLFAFAILLIAFGLILTKRENLLPGLAVLGMTWVCLGVLGACIANQPLPAEHVLTLLERGQIDLHTPLRWHGRLRDERSTLPWGYGYEIELSSVDYQSTSVPARGGMRLSYTPRPGANALPDLHAGDAVSVLTQATRPQMFKDEGAFDRRAYLAQENIHLVANLRAPELLQRVSVAKPTFSTLLARARRRLRDQVDTMFGTTPQVASVLRAMLLGDRSFVDRDEATDFQKTGVFHVLVVAGLHVGALAAFLFQAGRKLRLRPAWTVLFTLTILFSYVAVVEQRSPVLRAALMAVIIVLGRLFYRRLELLNSAGLAALILLIAKPLAIRESSFQLTFLAIGCIAGLAMPWLARTVEPYAQALRGWRDVTRDVAHEPRAIQFRIDLRTIARWFASRMPRRLIISAENTLIGGIALSLRVWELFVLTLVLQIGMLPLMARDFHRITLSAPLVNLMVVPLTSVVVPLGFVTLGTGLLVPTLGKLLSVPLGWLTLTLLSVVQFFARSPGWGYRIPGPPLRLLLLFILLTLLLAVALRIAHSWHRWTRGTLCACLIICSILISLFPFSPKSTAGNLELTILDVGQGDSLFLISPRGRTLLIDGGGAFGGFPGHEEHNGIDPGEEAVSPYLWSRGFQKLDVVALTHAHQDHLGGLTAILQNFRVGKLWIGREVSSKALAKLEELAHAKRIPLEYEGRGNSFVWDGVSGEFLWPEASSTQILSLAKNNDSLVLRLRYGNRSLLLPGDAEKESERAILADANPNALQADVLKIGHHGSKNSTLPEFLAAVRPRVAVISAGENNPYGHPSPELIERLESAGIRILRTDRDGAIHVLTDGDRMVISCFVACPEKLAENLTQAQMPDHY
jgi:competence protein ComEC